MPVTIDQARAIGLGLPGAYEQDHHGIPSLRVAGKIYATIPDDQHIRVMVDEPEIRAAVAENPGVCVEFYWGKRLACVVVELSGATPELVRELLTEAWLRRAPKALRQGLG